MTKSMKYDDPTDPAAVAFCMATLDPALRGKSFEEACKKYPAIVHASKEVKNSRRVQWKNKKANPNWPAKARVCVAAAGGAVAKAAAAAVVAEEEDEDDLPLTELAGKKKGDSSIATANASASGSKKAKSLPPALTNVPAAKKHETAGGTEVDGGSSITFPPTGIVNVMPMPNGDFYVKSQDNNVATVTVGILPSVVKTMIVASGPALSSATRSTNVRSVEVAEYGDNHFIVRSKGEGGGLAVVTDDILGVIVAAMSNVPASDEDDIAQAPLAPAPADCDYSEVDAGAKENGTFGFLV